MLVDWQLKYLQDLNGLKTLPADTSVQIMSNFMEQYFTGKKLKVQELCTEKS